MTSKVQICNLALSRLGANTITALTDNTTEAKLCNTFFDDIADEVMVEGSWTSTITRATLARTANTPVFGWAYEFQLPVDPKCLKVLNINEDPQGQVPYKIEGDKLVADDSTIKIRYIARLTDTEDWDTYLRRSVVAKLASELAYPLTGDTRKSELEYRRYQALLAESIAMNNQQGSKDTVANYELTEVR